MISGLLGSLPLPELPAAVDGGMVDIGVRPHDIEVCAPESADVSGRVSFVERLGSSVLLHVRVDAAADPLVRVLASPDLQVAADGPVHLRVARDRLHVFDRQTGLRLS